MNILQAAARVSKLLCAGSQSFAMHDKSYRLMTSVSAIRRFRSHSAAATLNGGGPVCLVDLSARKLCECPILVRQFSCKKIKDKKKRDCNKTGTISCARCQKPNVEECKEEEIEDPCPCLEPAMKKPKKQQKKRCKKKKCTGEEEEDDEEN